MKLRRPRRRRKPVTNATPTWQDNLPAQGMGDRADRYMRIPEIDRWRAVPHDMPPSPDRDAVMQRVRREVTALAGSIDEGTGGALDPMIEAWVAGWIAIVETDHVDHCGVIQIHRNQAAQWLAESTILARDEREELDRARAAYLACRSRLAGEQAGHAPGPDVQISHQGEAS
jgi:hypothetical protein